MSLSRGTKVFLLVKELQQLPPCEVSNVLFGALYTLALQTDEAPEQLVERLVGGMAEAELAGSGWEEVKRALVIALTERQLAGMDAQQPPLDQSEAAADSPLRGGEGAWGS